MNKRGAPQNGKHKTDRLGVYLFNHHPILSKFGAMLSFALCFAWGWAYALLGALLGL